MPTIAASIIVKDEAEHLKRCLASLTGLVDEIVVVDTGSSDDSVAVAESFGAKVGHFQWCRDFAAARNALLGMVTSDWFLHIDADEELKATRTKLEAAIQGADQVAIGILDYYSKAKPTAIRLHRMVPGIHWTRPVHETIVWPGKPKIRDADETIHLIHYGYAPEVNEGKIRRNLDYLREHSQKEPDDGLTWLLIARECGYLSLNEEGLAAALNAIEWCEDEQLADAYAAAGWHALTMNRFAQVEELTKDARRMGAATALTEYMRARALQQLGQLAKAAEAAHRSIHLPDPVSLLGLHYVLSDKRHELARELAG